MNGGGFDSKRAGDRAIQILVTVCMLLVAGDFFYDKHGHYAAEEWLGFYALYGALSIVGIVLLARVLRRIVMRDEDYYD